MYLFLGQTVDNHPDRLIRAKGNDAESFRLSIRPILEELHVLKIGNAYVSYGVSYILVGRPPSQIADVKLKTAAMMAVVWSVVIWNVAVGLLRWMCVLRH